MRYVFLALTLLACACREKAPPAPTAEQNRQLDEAEAMLNGLGNEKGPEATAPGPSNSSD